MADFGPSSVITSFQPSVEISHRSRGYRESGRGGYSCNPVRVLNPFEARAVRSRKPLGAADPCVCVSFLAQTRRISNTHFDVFLEIVTLCDTRDIEMKGRRMIFPPFRRPPFFNTWCTLSVYWSLTWHAIIPPLAADALIEYSVTQNCVSFVFSTPPTRAGFGCPVFVVRRNRCSDLTSSLPTRLLKS